MLQYAWVSRVPAFHSGVLALSKTEAKFLCRNNSYREAECYQWNDLWSSACKSNNYFASKNQNRSVMSVSLDWTALQSPVEVVQMLVIIIQEKPRLLVEWYRITGRIGYGNSFLIEMPTSGQSRLNVSLQLFPASSFFWRSVSGFVSLRLIIQPGHLYVFNETLYQNIFSVSFFLSWHMMLFSKASVCLLWE